MKRIPARVQLFALSMLAMQPLWGAETSAVRLVASTETAAVIEGNRLVSGWKNLASAGFPVRVSPEDYRRVSAILNVYLHAPADNTQTVEVDPKLPVASRTYTAGALAGFYASRTFSFAHGLVTYTADSAWLMSTADTTATVPLPKGYTVLSATETDWESHHRLVQFHQNGDTLELKVRDSAKVNRYVIRYTKHGK